MAQFSFADGNGGFNHYDGVPKFFDSSKFVAIDTYQDYLSFGLHYNFDKHGGETGADFFENHYVYIHRDFVKEKIQRDKERYQNLKDYLDSKNISIEDDDFDFSYFFSDDFSFDFPDFFSEIYDFTEGTDFSNHTSEQDEEQDIYNVGYSFSSSTEFDTAHSDTFDSYFYTDMTSYASFASSYDDFAGYDYD